MYNMWLYKKYMKPFRSLNTCACIYVIEITNDHVMKHNYKDTF